MMAYLFIGGVADGERRRVPDDQWSVQFKHVHPTEAFDYVLSTYGEESMGQAKPIPIQHDTYRRRTLDHSGLAVFALSDMSPLDIMKALVQNYKTGGE